MPVLKQTRSTTEVKLPESKGTVQVYKEFLTGDYRQLMQDEQISADTKSISASKSFEFVLRLIASWDFTDEENKELPITAENLDLLPISDLNILAQHVANATKASTIGKDVKKN